MPFTVVLPFNCSMMTSVLLSIPVLVEESLDLDSGLCLLNCAGSG